MRLDGIDLDGEAPAVGEQALQQLPGRRARELAHVTIEVRLIVVAGRDRKVCEIGSPAGDRADDATKSQHAGEDLRRDADFVLELGDEVPLAPADLLHDGGDARPPARGDQPVPRTTHTRGHVQRVADTHREGVVEALETRVPRRGVIQAMGDSRANSPKISSGANARFFMSSIGRPTRRRMPRSVKLTWTPLEAPLIDQLIGVVSAGDEAGEIEMTTGVAWREQVKRGAEVDDEGCLLRGQLAAAQRCRTVRSTRRTRERTGAMPQRAAPSPTPSAQAPRCVASPFREARSSVSHIGAPWRRPSHSSLAPRAYRAGQFLTRRR